MQIKSTGSRGLFVAILLTAVVTAWPAASASAAGINTSCARTSGKWSATDWSYKAPKSFGTNQHWCNYDDASAERVVWQSDGNLVAYMGAHSGKGATWASGTQGRGHTLSFHSDGNVAIADSRGKVIWSSRTHNANAAQLKLSYETTVLSITDPNYAGGKKIDTYFTIDSSTPQGTSEGAHRELLVAVTYQT